MIVKTLLLGFIAYKMIIIDHFSELRAHQIIIEKFFKEKENLLIKKNLKCHKING